MGIAEVGVGEFSEALRACKEVMTLEMTPCHSISNVHALGCTVSVYSL